MGLTLSVATAFVRNPGVSMPIVRFTEDEIDSASSSPHPKNSDSSHLKIEILHATDYGICLLVSRKIV